MAIRPGVAGAKFKRVAIGDTSKIAMKGQPSDVTVSDPQLHYILRLCHPDTSHKDAAHWIQKLDDHNTQHTNDRDRLVEKQVQMLGDLSIIVSFMHTLSSSLAMLQGSKKSGLLFTGRTTGLEGELKQYKIKANFGDHLVPMDNLLEPGVAGNALQALSNYVIVQAGASLGSLYEDMLEECLAEIEKRYTAAKARLEKGEKTFVPLPTEESQPTTFRVESRREKAKTRSADTPTHDITALAPPLPLPRPPTAPINVKALTASVFHTMFAKSEARSSVLWADFAGAMADLGFSVTPKGGSILTFNPPQSVAGGSITLHRPYVSQIEGWKLLYFARRLGRTYGWDAETFVVV